MVQEDLGKIEFTQVGKFGARGLRSLQCRSLPTSGSSFMVQWTRIFADDNFRPSSIESEYNGKRSGICTLGVLDRALT